MAVTTAAPEQEITSELWNEIAGLLNGTTGYGKPVFLTEHDSDSVPTLTLRNLGDGGALRIIGSDGVTDLLTVNDNGVTIAGNLLVEGDLLISALGWIDVTVYGADPTGVLDSSVAIMLAYADLAATGGVLYFPPGTYRIAVNCVFNETKPFWIVGAGSGVTILNFVTTTGNGFSIGDGASGPSLFGMRDLSLRPTVARGETSYGVYCYNLFASWFTNLYCDFAGGNIWGFEGCIYNTVSNVFASATDGSGLGGGCFYQKGGAITMNNVTAKSGLGGTATLAKRPTYWLTGTSNSNRWNNCIFSAGGTRCSYSISSATANGTLMVIDTQVNHSFRAGDLVRVRGVGVAAYNNAWRVYNVTAANRISIDTTTAAANVGAGGVLESYGVAFYVDNENGPQNESVMTGCLTTRVTSAGYGHAGIHLDGNRGTHSIEGWIFDGCWFDGGGTGIVIQGSHYVPGVGPLLTYGIHILGGYFSQALRGVHVEYADAVHIRDIDANMIGVLTPITDGMGPSAPVYVYGGNVPPGSYGITIKDSNLGWPRNFGHIAGSAPVYGVHLDYPVDMLEITGNHIAGVTAAIGMTNSAYAATRHWKIEGNTCVEGGGTLFPPTDALLIPTLTAASSVALPVGYDTVKLTGATTINNLTQGWHGRKINLLAATAITFGTGGNMPTAAARSMLARDADTAWFDGSAWFMK